MPPAKFKLAIAASERPQTHALDRASLASALYVFKEYILLIIGPVLAKAV
jgi:hypothetical protein